MLNTMNNNVSKGMTMAMAEGMDKMLTAKCEVKDYSHIRGKHCPIAIDGAELNVVMDGYGAQTWRKSKDGVIYKKCKKCKKWHPIGDFATCQNSGIAAILNKDGRSSVCMDCQALEQIEKAKNGEEFKVKLNNAQTGRKSLTEYSDAELLRELRLRGYKGELSFTKVVTV